MAPFHIGEKVIIRAKGGFYAYVDGWDGIVDGYNNGLVVVRCVRADGVKTLFVKPDEVMSLKLKT